jgi:Tol biopolymer transport system component
MRAARRSSALGAAATIVCQLCAVCALVLGATACGGAGNDREGTIAFVREPSSFAGGARLHVIDAVGRNERRIGTRDVSGMPAWSPHGDEVAYTDTGGTVIVAQAAGGERRINANCYGPTWSPAGGRIACDFTEPWIIRIVDSMAGSFRTITPDCCSRPAWSPDGRQLVYYSIGRYDGERYVGRSGTFVMNADGSGSRRLTGRGSSEFRPAWSSDGHTIALTDGSRIWTIQSDGTHLHTLLEDGRTTRDLAWSPNGTTLAFTHGDGHDFEVFLIKADGTGLRNATDNDRVHDRTPAWSPDGSAIAFASERDGNSEIYVMNADGTEQTRVTENVADDDYPQWKPTP